jgi:hypothetical protein
VNSSIELLVRIFSPPFFGIPFTRSSSCKNIGATAPSTFTAPPQQGIAISRDAPAEIFGAFLTYYTRQELLSSLYGEDLMDLQPGGSAASYVILDDQLGTRRIADLLKIPHQQAQQLAPLFLQAFEQLAPGRVFRDEEHFVRDLVLPRLQQGLQGSPAFAAAFSALESEHIRIETDRRDDSDYFYRELPSAAQPPAAPPLRALRDVKGDTWRFRGVFSLHPADAAGNILNHKFVTWAEARIEFVKVDRAFLAAGEYQVNVYGGVARAWSAGGPFDPVAHPDIFIPIAF